MLARVRENIHFRHHENAYFENYIENVRPVPKPYHANKLLIGKRGGRAEGTLAGRLKVWQEQSDLGAQLCWHVLRHSIATTLVRKGMSIQQVSLFLGHKNIASTAIYLHHIQ